MKLTYKNADLLWLLSGLDLPTALFIMLSKAEKALSYIDNVNEVLGRGDANCEVSYEAICLHLIVILHISIRHLVKLFNLKLICHM